MTEHALATEESIIQTYLAPLAAGEPGAFGLLDDCAAITPSPGCDLVVKTDPIAAGVHFFADDPAVDIGWKALAVNVSDLIAKGARPRAYVMALSFPQAPARAWMTEFAAGLTEAQSAFEITLVGGDTDRRPGPLSISITVFGEVPTGRMVRRGAARSGDLIYVSGTIGDAWAGLQVRLGTVRAAAWPRDVDRSAFVARYRRPAPPKRLAPVILEHARAAMDVSDGLLKDADRMARASGVRITVLAPSVPLSPDMRRIVVADGAALADLLGGGDDYQVLAAVPAERVTAFEAAAAIAGTAVARIGWVRAGEPGAEIRDGRGQVLHLQRDGFDHF